MIIVPAAMIFVVRGVAGAFRNDSFRLWSDLPEPKEMKKQSKRDEEI